MPFTSPRPLVPRKYSRAVSVHRSCVVSTRLVHVEWTRLVGAGSPRTILRRLALTYSIPPVLSRAPPCGSTETKGLDLDALGIVDGKFCWVVFVDILVLQARKHEKQPCHFWRTGSSRWWRKRSPTVVGGGGQTRCKGGGALRVANSVAYSIFCRRVCSVFGAARPETAPAHFQPLVCPVARFFMFWGGWGARNVGRYRDICLGWVNVRDCAGNHPTVFVDGCRAGPRAGKKSYVFWVSSVSRDQMLACLGRSLKCSCLFPLPHASGRGWSACVLRLQADGNLLDASSFAAYTALNTARIPKVCSVCNAAGAPRRRPPHTLSSSHTCVSLFSTYIRLFMLGVKLGVVSCCDAVRFLCEDGEPFSEVGTLLLVTPRESCMTFTPHITSFVGIHEARAFRLRHFLGERVSPRRTIASMGTFSFLAHYSLRSLCVLVAFSAFYRVSLFLVICNTAPRPPPPLEIRAKR